MQIATHHRPFLRLVLVSFAVLLFIPILIGSVAYRTAFHVVERNVRSTHLLILEHAAELWATKLLTLRRVSTAITTDPTVRRFAFVDRPYEGAQIVRVVEVLQSLGRLSTPVHAIEDLFLVYQSNGVVIRPQTAYRLERFYPWHFRYQDVPASSWLQSLAGVPHGLIVLSSRPAVFSSDTTVDVIPVVSRLPAPTGSVAHLEIVLRTDTITDLFGGIDDIEGAGVSIVDWRGEPVVESGRGVAHFRDRDDIAQIPVGAAERRIDGQRYLVTKASAPGGLWSVLAVVPVRAVTADLLYVRRVTMLTVVSMIAAGIGLGAYFGIRIMKPVEVLWEDSAALRREIARHHPVLVSELIQRILRGDFATTDEIQRHSTFVGIHLPDGMYCVAVLVVRPSLSRDQATVAQIKQERHVLADSIARTASRERAFVQTMGPDSVAVMLARADRREGDSLDSELHALVLNAVATLPSRISRHCCCGVGTAYPSLLEVPRSTDEARMALDHMMIQHKSGVLNYRVLARPESRYSYPADLEARVLNLVRGGQTADLRRLLADLRRDNVDAEPASPLSGKLYADDLLCTVVKAIDSCPSADPQGMAQIRTSVEEAVDAPPHVKLECSEALLVMLSEKAADRRTRFVDDVVDQIIAYLEEHYSDPGLSRRSVADAFRMSEAYLSQSFHGHTGKTFVSHLQNVRMTEAERLLSATRLPVTEIVARTGYYNYATFARAFKRVHGISATEYRLQRRGDA